MKILIIEQDVITLNKLTNVLKETFPNILHLRFANTVNQAVMLLKNGNPDIVFMCFLLKDGDAFDVLRKVSHFDFKIFFTSGFNGNIPIASEQTSMSFFLKPYNPEKIIEFIGLSKNSTPKTHYTSSTFNFHTKLLLPIGGGHVAIKTDEIIKCVAEGNYTNFYLKDRKHLVNYPIKYYDSLLCNKGFFRINRSILVNIGHIIAIHKKETLVLTNNERVIVSRRNKENLKKLINHLS